MGFSDNLFLLGDTSGIHSLDSGWVQHLEINKNIHLAQMMFAIQRTSIYSFGVFYFHKKTYYLTTVILIIVPLISDPNNYTNIKMLGELSKAAW